MDGGEGWRDKGRDRSEYAWKIASINCPLPPLNLSPWCLLLCEVTETQGGDQGMGLNRQDHTRVMESWTSLYFASA